MIFFRMAVLTALLLNLQGARAEVAATLVKSDVNQARIAKLIANSLPVLHLSHAPCDDSVAQSALDIYLDSLDYEHSYFLAPDVERFRSQSTNLDDQLKRGDTAFAFEIYELFKQRVTNRVAYLNKLLDEGFDLTQAETYDWKRKDAPWPADEQAWDDLWRKKIKNDFVARVVAREFATNVVSTATIDTNALEEAAAATNAAATDASLVEGVDGDAESAPTAADIKATPEEAIRKAYSRYLTLLNDNDAMWVLERYFNAFTQAYDPHSDYMSPNNAEDFDIAMKLSLVGIGALLSSEDGAAKVERLIAGGPAERDGRLKPGDKIVAVAQGDAEPVDILHLPLNKAVRMIRGEKDTKVVLSVIPASDISGSTLAKIDLIRDEVKLEEQAAKSDTREIKGTDGIARTLGVITLPEFYADMKGEATKGDEARSSARDVKRIIGELKEQGVQGIILDLRNNGGGSLSEAVEMTGEFIDSGPVVQVKDQKRLHILSDPDPEIAYGGPLVVLVNRMSASASEILAGALQDYGRALIVGDSKTHGKGTVQTLTNLSNADPALGSLKVTTASFFRIAGGSTQLNGVTPDIVISSALDEMELGEEFLPHALKWSTVYPAFYEPQTTVKDLIPTLENESKARREQDPRFATFSKVLEKVGERQKSKEISLNIEDRIGLAKSERELQDALRTPGEDGDEADKNGKDIVLSETLSILSDLVIHLEQAAAENRKILGKTKG
ncbi:MAG: carboxy terminal-processing peptidase [bacterium]